VDRSGKGFRMKIESIRVSRNLRGDGKTVLKRRKFNYYFSGTSKKNAVEILQPWLNFLEGIEKNR